MVLLLNRFDIQNNLRNKCKELGYVCTIKHFTISIFKKTSEQEPIPIDKLMPLIEQFGDVELHESTPDSIIFKYTGVRKNKYVSEENGTDITYQELAIRERVTRNLGVMLSLKGMTKGDLKDATKLAFNQVMFKLTIKDCIRFSNFFGIDISDLMFTELSNFEEELAKLLGEEDKL
jgi:hypothetical protein